MPPKKKKKKPDGILGRISPAMKSEHFEMAGGGYGSRGTGTSRAALSGLMKNFMRQFTGKTKPPKAPKKPVTPVERATGSRRGVPVGTNQKTNAIKRAAAAKKKPGTASNPNDSAARAKVRSRKSSAKFDAKVKWGKEFYKSRRATTPKPTKKTTKKTKKKGK